MLAAVGVALHGVVDTCILSREHRGMDALGGHSLATVVERELRMYLSKEEQTSSWTRRPLSDEQIAYAAADAAVLLEVHARFPQASGPRLAHERAR